MVDRVLKATAEELGRVGYEALRFEDVAARSGVHKTTIYRRWPTRAELVEATLVALATSPDVRDRGDVVSDLTALLGDMARFARSPLGRGILRTIQNERHHPELAPVLRKLRVVKREAREGIVRRAVERGELPPGTDAAFVLELVTGALMSRILGHGERVDQRWIRRAVSLVVAGAKAGGAIAPRGAPR